jgi:putative sigma-54 modulation protein
MMNQSSVCITITARHLPLTESIKEYILTRVHSIALDFPELKTAHVILDFQRYLQRCEIIVKCHRRATLRATDESKDLYLSIGCCLNKLDRQLRKHKTLMQRHRRDFSRRGFVCNKWFDLGDGPSHRF